MDDPGQPTENHAIQQPSGIAGDGETRTRTGDTTIFSRVALLLSLADLQGFSAVLRVSVLSASSRTLRSFPV
jgi:hypothetical protein